MIRISSTFVSVILVVALGSFFSSNARGQDATAGLIHLDDRVEDGYILWGPIFTDNIYLMNNCGRVVHSWNNGLTLGNSMYLLEDGNLLRTAKENQVNSVVQVGGGGQRIQLLDWDGNTLWDFSYTSDSFRAHHDIAPMPNGNVLVLAWEAISKKECLRAGRDSTLLTEDMIFSEFIVEVEPTGKNSGRVVWEWHLWDHLVQDRFPSKDNYAVVGESIGRLDVNFINRFTGNPGEADWIHANALDYNKELDQIMFSSQRLGEIYIIDHSTTSEEAKVSSGGKYGKGGDFIYRWGNPQAYQRGDSTDQKLWGLHNCRWIEPGLLDAGKIMIFNNGNFNGPQKSSILVIDPPQSAPGVYVLEDSLFGPKQPFWEYKNDNFYSYFISGAQRLPNGNTLICSGANGNFFEVTYGGEEVWRYVNPEIIDGVLSQGDIIPSNGGGLLQNIVFRAEKYPPGYAAFGGRDLSPKKTIEPDPIETDCSAGAYFPPSFVAYPNPASDLLNIQIQNVFGVNARIYIYNALGRKVFEEDNPKSKNRIDISTYAPGIYIIKVGEKEWGKFLKTR